MSIARGQSPATLPVDKIVPDHLEFKRLYGAPPPAAAAAKEAPLSFRAGGFGDLGGGYYVDHLGFFCKRELGIQKTLHLPVYFRLGSLEYCNRLEGK